MRKTKTLPAFKNANLTHLARGTGRKFPPFYPGRTSVADYARQYFYLNHAQTCHTPDCAFFTPLRREPAATYDPTQPQVVHEVLDDAGQWVLV